MFFQKFAIVFLFSFLLCLTQIEAQQLKLGKHPTQTTQSAVLELESPNQGLLLTRISDTTAINAFNPPNGMIIYFTGNQQTSKEDQGLYIRKNNTWHQLIIDTDSIGIEPWHVQGTTKKATQNSNKIYIMNAVAIGKQHAIEGTLLDVAGAFRGGRAKDTTVGDASFAFGEGTSASSENQIAMGKYNEDISNALFELGYGTENEKKNLLTILKNGNIGMGINPTVKLDIGDGKVKIASLPSTPGSANNKLVVVDNNGILKSVSTNVYNSAQSWNPGGNTADADDFLGTKNNQALRFRQENQPAGFIKDSSVALGKLALKDPSLGSNNTAMGWKALYKDTTGHDNTAIGWEALKTNTHGDENTAVGTRALYQLDGNARRNTGIGAHVKIQDNFDHCTAVGYRAMVNADNTLDFATALGARSLVEQSYSLVLGCIKNVNTADSTVKVGIGTTTPNQRLEVVGNIQISGNKENTTESYYFHPTQSALGLYSDGSKIGSFDAQTGTYSTISDFRLKENIQPLHPILKKIGKIKIARFTFKKDQDKTPQIGYIAQNLKKTFPEFVQKNQNNYYSVNYAGMSSIAIKAIQEQQKIIQQLQHKTTAQQKSINELRQRIEQLEKQ